jgi:hypothetical protein
MTIVLAAITWMHGSGRDGGVASLNSCKAGTPNDWGRLRVEILQLRLAR